MTTEEFNKKYEKYIEPRFYGLDISDEDFINWLDNKFEVFITKSNFKFHQIKIKFGMGRFYCEGLSQEEVYEVEEKISNLCKNN